jgi:hypothetical protein
LDNGENGLLKTFIQQLQEPPSEAWTARTIRQSIAKTLPRAYSSAFTMDTIIRSFRVTGIWPVDASQVADRLHHADGGTVSASKPVVDRIILTRLTERKMVFVTEND